MEDLVNNFESNDDLEEVEDAPNVPKEKKFSVKTFGQKFMTVIAGIMNNFVLAIVLLFFLVLLLIKEKDCLDW